MKKVVKFIATAAIGLPLVFSSCASEDPAKPLELDLTQTSTFKVTLLGCTDQSEPAVDRKFAPAPIKAEHIVASVPYENLSPMVYDSYWGYSPLVSDGYYFIPQGDIKYNTSTGELEITVPVVYNKMVYLSIDFLEASGECKVDDGDGPKTVKGVWYFRDGSIGINMMPGRNVFYGTYYISFRREGAKVGDDV